MLVLLGGCAKNFIKDDKTALSKQGSQDLTCGSAKAEVVYYGLRGADVPASSPCFGESAQALAVVECAGKRKAYWKNAGHWEARPGEITSVDATGIEISLSDSQNTSGSVAATARCAR